MSIKKIIKKVLLEETEQNQWVEVDPQDYLELLKYVDGNGAMISKLPQYKNKKISIDGDLKINSEDIKNIDSVEYVNGNLDISYSGIRFFDKNKVKGDFRKWYSQMDKIEKKKELEKKYDYLKNLRENDSWNVENKKDISERTEALYKHLLSKNEIRKTEINGQEVDEDKYYIYPLNYNTKGKMFEWLGEEDFESEWMVYEEDELYEAAKDYVKNLIDELGMNAFREWVYENNLDKVAVKQYYYEYFEYLVRESPEDYNVTKDFSSEQEKFLEVFRKKLSNLYVKLNQSTTEEEKNTIQETIDNTNDLIEDIEENPEGDYNEDSIEKTIDNIAEDNIDNFINHVKDIGYDTDFILNYLDIDGITEDVIQSDGYGHLLNGYDGRQDEYKINETWYSVMRNN
jgi:hypothetical protein